MNRAHPSRPVLWELGVNGEEAPLTEYVSERLRVEPRGQGKQE